MYCSESCHNHHRELHASFCNSEISQIKFNIRRFEVCSSLMMKGIAEYGSFRAYFNFLKNGTRSTIFDYGGELTEKDKITLLSLLNAAEGCDIGQEIAVRYREIFDLPLFKPYWKTKNDLDDLIWVFNKIFTILNTNSLQLSESNSHSIQNNFDREIHGLEETFGSGFCLFGSMFNHSCDPNLNRVAIDNKVVFFTNRPIKSSEQLFINYSASFALSPLYMRKKTFEQYSFECDCQACIYKYPIQMNLSRKVKRYVAPTFGPFEKTAAIESLKKDIQFIEKIWKFHPCYESSNTIQHILHLMYEIARPEL